MIVLDANILIRAVLGKRVRELIDTYAAQGVRFFAPDVAFADAEKYFRLSITHETTSLLSYAASLAAAVAAADRFVAVNRPDARRLIERSARWRNELPSDKQREVLARNRIPAPAGLTRGQAAQMIAQLVSARSLRSSQ
jgi:predicted nucleic acid-binding protein